ncbi:F-box protein CPR1-like [Papaver somniferum]|uniref:F-box protein CPR1-like n=1 Tax=Papaver somniferum TaxID=3469 RepID=UPI000E704928|nr:F-box protein CPR1-like [Papaver somniferum]
MDSIPEAVFSHDIFSKLPVKSLLACKCVCKTWYDLISDPDFVKSHIDLTIQTNKPTLLLRFPDHVVRSILPDSLKSSDCNINAKRSLCPRFRFTSYYTLLCSCKGIVCIRYAGSLGYRGSLLSLWNPATREYKIIPKPPSTFGFGALGYDCNTNDYKLVVVDNLDGDGYSSKVQVYSLASNSWKSNPSIPYTFPHGHGQASGVLFNGFLHWLALDRNSCRVIVSLDVRDESFRKLRIPDDSQKFDLSLGFSAGCLCLLAFRARSRLVVWEMLDYGVQESWTKRCIYTLTNKSGFRDEPRLSLVRYLEKGKILLRSSDSLVLYDPKCTARVHGIFCLEWVNYFESLVSLSSGTYVGGDGIIEYKEP